MIFWKTGLPDHFHSPRLCLEHALEIRRWDPRWNFRRFENKRISPLKGKGGNIATTRRQNRFSSQPILPPDPLTRSSLSSKSLEKESTKLADNRWQKYRSIRKPTYIHTHTHVYIYIYVCGIYDRLTTDPFRTERSKTWNWGEEG